MTGSSNWIVKSRRLAIYVRDGFRCVYCDADLRGASAAEMGLDHLDDLVPGGGHAGANHASNNLVTACRACNSARGNKPWACFCTDKALYYIKCQRTLPVNMKLARQMIASGTVWADGGDR